jgi:hypothetical protein
MDRSNSNVAGKQKPLKPNVDDSVLYFIFVICLVFTNITLPYFQAGLAQTPTSLPEICKIGCTLPHFST